MRKRMARLVSLLLSVTLVFSTESINVFAGTISENAVFEEEVNQNRVVEEVTKEETEEIDSEILGDSEELDKAGEAEIQDASTGEDEAANILSALSGSGTESSPYLIYSAADLKLVADAYAEEISNVYYFRLQNDIDLSEYQWLAIGNEYSEYSSSDNSNVFDGVFDGNSHTINLLCHKTSDDETTEEWEDDYEYFYYYKSLFAENHGTIKNLNVVCMEGGYTYSGNTDAPICWENYGTIENCNVSGALEQVEWFCGITEINRGLIKDCTVDMDVSGGELYGITALNTGNIEGCLVEGIMTVLEEDNYSAVAAGIAERNEGSIKDTVCNAVIKEAEYDSGANLIGFVNNNGDGYNEENIVEGYIERCGFTGKITGTNQVGFVTYNCGEIDDCYVKTDFLIEGENGTIYESIYATHGIDGFISHNDGVISNSYLEGNIVAKSKGVEHSLFCRENDISGTISSCSFNGNFNVGEGEGYLEIGGLINVNRGIVKESYMEGMLEVNKWDATGGLVGVNEKTGLIEKCYAKVNIQYQEDISESDLMAYVGGLAGTNRGKIEQSYVVGAVSTSNAYATGGLVGRNVRYSEDDFGIIKDCYANVEISVPVKYPDGGVKGGLVGSTTRGTIINCYAVSDYEVDYGKYVGGIIGYDFADLKQYVNSIYPGAMGEGDFIDNTPCEVNSSFFINSYPANANYIPQAGGTAKSIQDLRNPDTYTSAGWDFINTWKIDKNKNEGFPYLQFAEDVLENQTYYTATVITTDGGSVLPNGSFEIYQGENYDFSIEPSNGYEIKDVKVNGVSQGKVSNYRLLNASGETKVEVIFQKLSVNNASNENSSNSENSGNNANTDNNGNVGNNAIPAKKGTKIISGTTAGEFKVTSSDSANPTVAYIGTTNKKKKNISIPEHVTYQGIKYKVTSVAAKAFKGNKKVTTVKIATGITKIDNSAFEGCTSLKTVTIGKDMQNIGKNAFKNCKKLTKIAIKGTKLKKVGENALKGINKKCKIKVPKKKVNAYKKLFKNKGQKSVKITK